MSSEEAAPDGAAVQCRWPGCPSRFTGAPKAQGWRKIAITPELSVVLCPFHAVEHIPSVVTEHGLTVAVCSCRGMIPCRRPNAPLAMRDWRAHAREINGPEDGVTCPECFREFESSPAGLVPRHNAWDRNRGRLLASVCFGAGQPSAERVRS